ncbi:hypothetical protein VM98_38690, partial [Streptomyces rubellomurinus subsp. indigoferus]
MRANRRHGLHLLPGARATLTSCRLTRNTEDRLRSESAQSVRLTDCLPPDNHPGGTRHTQPTAHLAVHNLDSRHTPSPEPHGAPPAPSASAP